MGTMIREITESVALCDREGRLNPDACGWSRHLLHVGNLRGRYLRKKKWDYWCVTGDRFLFSATLANVDYAGIASVYLLEYSTGRFAEVSAFRLFSRQPRMPEYPGGRTRFANRQQELTFVEDTGGIRMQARTHNFAGRPMTADLRIEYPPGHETLNVVVPWDARTFQFTSKQHCLPASGRLRWGDETLELNGAFACRDYGRGIWPYRTAWNWASCSTRAGADIIGINMGAKWTDGAGMNENGIVVNGRLHKIFEDIAFEYEPDNFMAPWRMKTVGADTVDLVFTPFYDKTAAANLLVLRSRVHQLFGHYDGTLKVAGRTFFIENAVGWAEEHLARW